LASSWTRIAAPFTIIPILLAFTLVAGCPPDGPARRILMQGRQCFPWISYCPVVTLSSTGGEKSQRIKGTM